MITNKHNLPDVIVQAVKNDPYTRGLSDITVTQLIDSPRAVALKKTYASEIEEDASDRIWSLLGQSVHSILERVAKANKETAEERVYANVWGWKLGGQFDLLSRGVLYDFKVTSVWKIVNLKNGADPQWEAQLNVLAWLMRHNSIAVSELSIIAILRDWSKHKAYKDDDYPNAQVVEVKVPMWSEDEQHRYIKERIHMHQKAQSKFDPMPDCTAEERWAKPDVYAVMKEGRKSAVKLYDNFNDASEHALQDKKFHVEHRKGGSVRCESYCSAAQFCSQYMDELRNG